MLADGTVAVWDGGKRAFLTFASDGSALDQVAPDYSTGVPAAPIQSISDRAVVALPSHLVSGRRGAIYSTGAGYQSASDGLPLMFVPVRSGAPIRVLDRVPTLQGGAADAATRAFTPVPSWGALAGGRVALATTDRYEIRILDAEGRHLRTLRRPVEARATTRADEEAFLRYVRERYERSLRRARGLRPVEPSGEVNAHPVIPPIQRITTDGARRIWVQRPDPADPTRPGPIDVIDAEGAYLGTVAGLLPGLPDAFGPDGLVVFLTVGEFDVPIARVYRLRATPSPRTPAAPPPASAGRHNPAPGGGSRCRSRTGAACGPGRCTDRRR